jgi:hypothetical protein
MLYVDKVKKYGNVHVTILLRRMKVKIALCWERMLNIEFVEDNLVQVCFFIFYFIFFFGLISLGVGRSRTLTEQNNYILGFNVLIYL